MAKIKQKTNRGAAKRFKLTKNGFKFRRAKRNHILTKKTTKAKRQRRALGLVVRSDQGRVRRMLPGA